ncbi:MAG: 2-oxoglutarate dehydrogenase E1 component [Pseudomonadales bacterium]|jgi:2-oxoglutarate dehydrogenase E1 component|nr:2-oxoglutarate dehydrogenase E1 component [Pseudomonadales bacterium]MDP4640959.1 2-oxoglutarate dehydrogenase E1 component [Pseudomonadales bacterium]MDP4766064.1 2-oxoglutarate dehydrogenase E1 component [Pseudomonadales bacterium]MDP4912095.1 2-oxoglutarate dehydrogenase E1 component [Pseudomonadales bacterium]MDP5060015.1 2-oxoglutarate dehydrogenase E1 component [Pseudomonadales bacterium]
MQESKMEQLWRSGHISGGNANYVEALYEQYLEDPAEVPEQWRSYFQTLPMLDGALAPDISHSTVRDHFLLLSKNQSRVTPVSPASINADFERKQVAVGELISGYRRRGHLKANLDPLGLEEKPPVPILSLEYHRLSAADLDTPFQTGTLFFGNHVAPLRDIIHVLEQTYCDSVGAEYMHIEDQAEQLWVQQRLESARSNPSYSHGVKRRIIDRLVAAEGLEKYLHTKYPGTKRFGLEGGESFIPCMAELIHRAGKAGVVETVIGMAHRGRINVLVNLMGKDPAELFDEFEGRYTPGFGSGDVKYHQGFSSNLMTPGGEMHLALGFNPSHLEIAAPVIEGSVRARMDRREDASGDKVMAINVHGDAAFAGQGVVMETFQMSQTRGFYTGGTVHVIINNQIGYTISKQEDARSTRYCTEIAKMVQAPIFHVNGDDPEAVIFVSQLAVDYRMEFHKDVVIDMVCYRRRGHNEGDEPSITQPIMYKAIRQHPTTLTLYAEKALKEGVLDEADYQSRIAAYRDALDRGEAVAWDFLKEPDTSMFVDWRPFLGHEWTAPADTRYPLKKFQRLANQLMELPDGFVLQKQVGKILDDRKKMTAGALPLNWGYAEIMAYATLLAQGHNIRLIGQDVARGTFSHRHAALHDQKAGLEHVPLKNMGNGQARFDMYDSFLSEEAVLAFEYGYAQTSPTTLVIWEAQFGDFANGAQVVIDQFITSGEHKWARLCGLTLLLPHGYEGAGPEHSSARLERFLQLCAEHNIQVCVPTTPAQMYHLLRRQAIRPLRRPLIVMTPKSLLRHKDAISTLEDLSDGKFQNVIDDPHVAKPADITRVVFCSGKVYYDLDAKRQEDQLTHVAIVRIEQLYPFPDELLKAILKRYKNIAVAAWCQEEPMNQGAWYSSQHHIRRAMNACYPGLYLHYAGRDPSAAAAAGYVSLHVRQQERLVHVALYSDDSSDSGTID